MKVVKQSQNAAAKAAGFLKNGGVIICPTDTVYGFLADASNKKAVGKIYKIKKRPTSKPLPVFVKDMKMARQLAEIDGRQAKILKKFWPGKYTFILKRKSDVGRPIALYGVDKHTIALRIPKYSFLNSVLKKVNRPLAQTSVNISAKAPLNTIDQIISTFGKNKLVDLVINAGSLKNVKPSKIIDLRSSSTKIVRI